MGRWLRYAASRAGLWEMVTVALAGLLLARIPDDPDLWWHLANGRFIATTGRIPTHDPFSFTRAGAPWVNAFWLSDWLLYQVWLWGGWLALTAATVAVGMLIAGLLFRRTPGPYPLRAMLVLLACVPASALWRPRPQIASFLLLVLLDAALSRRPADRRLWLALPPFFALWANLHGGFIWGFLLWLAVLVGEGLDAWLGRGGLPRRAWGGLALSGLVSAGAVLLNPNGAALWWLPFHTLRVSLGIQEWASPDFHRPDLHPVLWLLFLLVLGLAWSGRRLPLAAVFKTLGFAYMGFVAVRGIVPFVLVAVPVVGQVLAAAWPEGSSASEAPASPVRAALHLLLAGALLAGLTWRLGALTRPDLVEAPYPSAAVDYLRRHRPPGLLYNDYNWGGYLIWALPEYPVFVDGRADLYGDEGLRQALHIANAAPDARALLDRYGVRLVLIPPTRPLALALPAWGWQVLYRDPGAVLFGR